MGSYIVAGARTPIGKFGGSLSEMTAVELGGVAIRAAVARAGIEPGEVDYVIMGQVLQAGAGQITARQAAILGGIPAEVPALTINKVCLSGLNAIALADQLIRAGEMEVAIAGGMESMSQAPYLVPKARFGARMGNAEMVDSMVHDGLWSTFLNAHMGQSSDEVNRELEISREEQDAWAARSNQRAAAAWDSGRLAEETVAVDIAGREGETTRFARDEGFRADTSVESMARLRPAFVRDGTITAGNASQISDGAAAVVVMSEERMRKAGLEPLAEIVSHGMSADRFAWLHTVPALAINRALAKAGSRPRTSSSRRSTRRLRRWRSTPRGCSASTKSESTSTAAQSHSATRSAPVGHDWPSRSPTRCVGAAPAWGRRPSAVAAARATPWS